MSTLAKDRVAQENIWKHNIMLPEKYTCGFTSTENILLLLVLQIGKPIASTTEKNFNKTFQTIIPNMEKIERLFSCLNLLSK